MRIDERGNRYERLLVLEPAPTNRHRQAMWSCVCDCGTKSRVCGGDLRSGKSQSCGCLQRESVTTHGHKLSGKPSPEYISWGAMKTRCLNPNQADWKYYGGRGITFCDRWLAFESFLADMGPRPAGTSIDRIDPNGNYEPSNCRWADAKTQVSNRRQNA